MLVTYDPAAGATYVELVPASRVARTVSVTDLVMVDLDVDDQPVGVEFAVSTSQITGGMLASVARAFPALKGLAADRRWLLTTA